MAEDRELQRWYGYVDVVDGDRVHLVLKDETTDQGDERELGDFPRGSFGELDVLEGMFVTVRVMSESGVRIDPVRPEERTAIRIQVLIPQRLAILVRSLHGLGCAASPRFRAQLLTALGPRDA